MISCLYLTLFHPFSCINRTTQLLKTADFPTLWNTRLWREVTICGLSVTRKPRAWLINCLKAKGFYLKECDFGNRYTVPSHAAPKLYEVRTCRWPVGMQDCWADRTEGKLWWGLFKRDRGMLNCGNVLNLSFHFQMCKREAKSHILTRQAAVGGWGSQVMRCCWTWNKNSHGP